MGVEASDDDVVTSAQAAVALLRDQLDPGARVLACAGLGVIEALEAERYEVVDRGPADAVVVGFHTTFDFDELDRAAAAVRAGARFVATNVDATYPGPDGLLPGNGAIVAAVATAAGRVPEVAGKPEPATVALVRERFSAELVDGPGLMVGDRPSTDGALAAALGWPFALVLSGVSDGNGGGGEPVPTDPAPSVRHGRPRRVGPHDHRLLIRSRALPGVAGRREATGCSVGWETRRVAAGHRRRA